jgi:preprotein translocase subunit SecF
MLKIIGETKIDFISRRRVGYIISAVLLLAGFISLIAHGGPRYSIDFSGGRLIEFGFPADDLSSGEVREALASIGLTDVEVQHYDAGGNTGGTSGVTLRIKEESLSDHTDQAASPTVAIIAALESAHPGVSLDLRREESVGPKIGGELRGRAVQALLFAMGAILIYVGFRYELTFALGAVAALFHDVLVVLGLFSILNLEISLPIVAAFLTIAGYSINDTIVLFDRIRERRKLEQRRTLIDVVNRSINQVLSRTLVTSLTTLFTAVSLWLFGGPVIHDFALAIVLGVIIGTYSSIFVATAIAYELLERSAKRGRAPRKSSSTAVTAS